MRRIAAILTVPLLALAACGDDSDEDEEGDGSEEEAGSETDAPDIEPAEDDPLLDAIDVSGDLGETPTVEFETPLEAEGAYRRLLIEGDGEALTEGVEADIHLSVFEGSEGEEVDNSFDRMPEALTFDQQALAPGMVAGLVEVPLGSRVVAALDAESMFGGSANLEQQGMAPDDTFVMVLDVLEPGPRRAEGTEVDPVEGLPTVSLDDEGAPTVEVPDGDPPTELVSQLLVEGDGPEVPEGGMVRAQYTGVLWDDGSVFDSSWERGQPATFSLGEVVEGWGQGLAGVPVGSQVLLVIPPELGYGAEGTGDGGIPGDATLIFVVDVLDAAPAPEGAGTAPVPGG